MDTQSSQTPRWLGYSHLGVLYVVWGSTYLAIRIAVREGAGFPPFWLGALRLLVAGLLLLGWARLRGGTTRVRWVELAGLARSAALLWLVGHGLVIWAEQRADSGYAALLVGAMPIWVAAMDAYLDRLPPSPLLVSALLTGFAGLAVLSTPVIVAGGRTDLLSVLALLIAPMSWGLGAVLQQRHPVELPSRVSSGYQQLLAGAGFVAVALATGEPLPHPTPAAWAGWAYLVVFGSLIAFTSFVAALRLLPTGVVMTYAYVNPVIAVILGHLVLGEPVTPSTVGGAALVIAGVAGVFRDRARRARRAALQAAPRPRN